MNTKSVIGIVVLIALVALGWYLWSIHTPGSASGPAAAALAGGMAGSGTVGDLLAMGSVKCMVTLDSESSGQGVVYVAGGKMSGDFSAAVNGQAMHAYMINDGSDIYSWTDQASQGFKTPVTTTSSSASASYGVDSSTKAHYSCKPWTADTSKFIPPTSVSFMSAAALPAR